MIHTYSLKGQTKRYRYYVCLQAQKRGWSTCPTKSVPAGEIERFVVEQIKRVGRDPALLEGTPRQMRQQQAKALADAQAEQKAVGRELARHHAAMKKLVATPDPAADRLAILNEQIQDTERRALALRAQIQKLERDQLDEAQVASSLAAFDPVWEQLAPREQARVIQLLVDRIDYDGKNGTVSITFHPNGLKTLAVEHAQHEVAA
jgi:site-specific DNA recombinase